MIECLTDVEFLNFVNIIGWNMVTVMWSSETGEILEVIVHATEGDVSWLPHFDEAINDHMWCVNGVQGESV